MAKTTIIERVQQRPHTVSELSVALGVSWKTADRYVDTLCREEGLIGAHTFRSGTRGALKIVFWNAPSTGRSVTHDRIFRSLESGKRKEDFSPLDIFQYVSVDYKKLDLLTDSHTSSELFARFIEPISKAQNQVLVFSGNLSWLAADEKASGIIKELFHRKVRVKILSRVEIPSMRNLETAYRIAGAGNDGLLEIRHMEQPLRGFVIDDSRVLLRETKEPGSYKPGELEGPMTVVYALWEPKWVAFCQKIFWQYWKDGFDAQKRLQNLPPVNLPGKPVQRL
ncbi:MAG: hypothetical protein Q7R47_04320 [Candidatus Diapherotrites archaeon]|nr:hypothetical protein [Candidatus Diapherotrites archaeon]